MKIVLALVIAGFLGIINLSLGVFGFVLFELFFWNLGDIE